MKPPISKVIPLLLMMSILAGGSGLARAGITAKTALGVFEKAKGEEALKNVVVVRGTHGTDQPEVWEIIALDVKSGGSVGYLVNGKRILKGGRVETTVGGAPVELKHLALDSNQAFRIADGEARKARVGFDSIDYQLRAVPLGYAPVWLVRLRDASGREAGVVEISGTTGAVTGGRWNGKRFSNGGAAVAAAPQPRVPQESEIEESADEMHAENRGSVDYAAYRKRDDRKTPDEHREALGGVWKRSTEGIENAGTQAKTGFSKIGSAVADIFRGRAEYRPSGQQRWTPNRGAASRGH
jgi:hypothetical protein